MWLFSGERPFSPGHTLLELTGFRFSGPALVHWPQHLQILTFHCISILQGQIWPGVWEEAVGRGPERTFGWTCCGPGKHVRIVCFKVKTAECFWLLPRRPTCWTAGERHVETRAHRNWASPCCLRDSSSKSSDCEQLGDLRSRPRAPVITSDWLTPARGQYEETHVKLQCN